MVFGRRMIFPEQIKAPYLELLYRSVDAASQAHKAINELDELVETGFVAVEENDVIVGFASLEIYSRKLAEIRSLVVADHRQGIGVGKKLVSACIERARQRNILEVMVVTSSDVFFQNCGFDFTLPGEKKALFIQPHVDQ